MAPGVGVIGLGYLGSAIVDHLLEGEYDVRGYDINPSKRDTAAEQGALAMGSSAAVASTSDVTLIVVGTGDQVEECLFASDGASNGVNDDDVVVVSSTVSPQSCLAWSDRLPTGVTLVDAPILGGPRIEDGNALVFAGGKKSAVDSIAPILKTFASDIEYLGDVGAGQMGKLVSNQLFWVNHIAMYETFRIADRFGINVPTLRGALKKSPGDNYALHCWGESTGKWAQDDLEIVIDLAKRLGISAPLIGRTREAWDHVDVEDIWNLRSVNYASDETDKP